MSQRETVAGVCGACVTSIPVSVVGNKHPLSDLPLNFLVNNQQHDSIEVESLTLSKKTQLPPLHIYSFWSGKLMARHEKCFYCYKNETDLHSYCLPKAVSHPHLEAQSLGSAEYKHLHVGHPNICREDKIKRNTLLWNLCQVLLLSRKMGRDRESRPGTMLYNLFQKTAAQNMFSKPYSSTGWTESEIEGKHPCHALPVKIHYVFVDTLKSQIEPWQNLNVVLSKFFIQVLKFWFGFQLSLIILWTLAKTEHF